MLYQIFLETLESKLSDGKTQRLRQEYKAQDDILPIPFTGTPYIMLRKQEYFCHQGRDYNKGKKDKYIEKKDARSCLYKKQKAHSTNKKAGLSSEVLR